MINKYKLLMPLIKYIKQLLILSLISFLLFLSSFFVVDADEINWIEVANTSNELQFIDPDSIKYSDRGFLSVVAKYSEINPDTNEVINTNTFLMAIDCDNRLFRKLSVNAKLKEVKNWETPINDKLIKKTIINSCSY